MDEYPSNSHNKKQPVTNPEEKPKKNIEKVIEGAVVRRKKPLGKRFSELFVAGEARTVGQYILFDVLLPAAKDTIAEVATQGVERMLFGDSRPASRRSGGRGQGTGSHVSYGQAYRRPGSQRSRDGWDEPRKPSRQARATHDFDEIVLATRAEAEAVVDQLFTLLDKFEFASVSDLYDLVGVTRAYTDDKWGWTDLRGAGVSRVRGGYLLDLPRPEPLD